MAKYKLILDGDIYTYFITICAFLEDFLIDHLYLKYKYETLERMQEEFSQRHIDRVKELRAQGQNLEGMPITVELSREELVLWTNFFGIYTHECDFYEGERFETVKKIYYGLSAAFFSDEDYEDEDITINLIERRLEGKKKYKDSEMFPDDFFVIGGPQSESKVEHWEDGEEEDEDDEEEDEFDDEGFDEDDDFDDEDDEFGEEDDDFGDDGDDDSPKDGGGSWGYSYDSGSDGHSGGDDGGLDIMDVATTMPGPFGPPF